MRKKFLQSRENVHKSEQLLQMLGDTQQKVLEKSLESALLEIKSEIGAKIQEILSQSVVAEVENLWKSHLLPKLEKFLQETAQREISFQQNFQAHQMKSHDSTLRSMLFGMS